jgi:hypothetical protein
MAIDNRKPFVIWSETEAGIHCEGSRSKVKSAFALARKLYREYRGHAQIVVRWEGTLIASDPSEFTMRQTKSLRAFYLESASSRLRKAFD